MRFCNLIHGWVLDRITKNKDADKADNDVAMWEFAMNERLPWQSERQPKTDDILADRDAFLALDEIETH